MSKLRAMPGHRLGRCSATKTSSCSLSDLADWLDDRDMEHVCGAPYHPQTKGKIERWHQTLKNRTLLESYYLPGDLKAQIEALVEYYNHCRNHESLSNLTARSTFATPALRGLSSSRI